MVVVGMFQTGEGLNLKFDLSLMDICKKSDYPGLCRSVVKGLKTPTVAIEAAIRQLMSETKQAMAVAQRQKSKPGMDVCYENYDDAYSNLETCLSNLKTHDKGSLNINLSAALTDYVTCDDAVAEVGGPSTLTRTNVMLREMASNCLYISSLIRFH